jgi:hypothetical protein
VAIALLTDPEAIRFLTNTGRLTRFVLACSSIGPLHLKSVSYYHGGTLAIMCAMLLVAEYLLIFIPVPESESNAIRWVEWVATWISSFPVGAVEIMLLPSANHLKQFVGPCVLDQMKTDALNGTSTKNYDRLNGTSTKDYDRLLKSSIGSIYLGFNLALDALFIIIKLAQVFRTPECNRASWSRAFTWPQRTVLIIAILVTCILSATLYAIIEALNNIDGGDQQSWSLGQWAAVITALYGIAQTLALNAMSPTSEQRSHPRSKGWRQNCTLRLMLISLKARYGCVWSIENRGTVGQAFLALFATQGETDKRDEVSEGATAGIRATGVEREGGTAGNVTEAGTNESDSHPEGN